MAVYYNENNPFAAQWLRNLIDAGHLPRGDVDERSIVDVRASDLAGYRQCHFFAGVGGWVYALRLAGWPDDREVWTGSCPCQPLSSAGQRRGHADERHLWPAFYALIAERRPATVFGEQVASKDGREWLAGVRADLERAGYACGAADLAAAGVGAPHIRQRLFWVADAQRYTGNQGRIGERSAGGATAQGSRSHAEPGRRCNAGGLADAGRAGDERGLRPGQTHGADAAAEGKTQQRQWRGADIGGGCGIGGLGDTENVGRGEECPLPGRSGKGDRPQGSAERSGAGFWADAVWLPCLDGKARRTQPGVFPLAHRATARVGRLRAYGNAIVPQVAAEFVRALLECT